MSEVDGEAGSGQTEQIPNPDGTQASTLQSVEVEGSMGGRDRGVLSKAWGWEPGTTL